MLCYHTNQHTKLGYVTTKMLLHRQLCIFASVLLLLSLSVKGQCSGGWSGSYCRRRNIVYGLSDSECGASSMVAGGNCALVADEDESTGISTQRQQNPFLWLKLSEISTIYFLKVVTTATYQYDLWGFRVSVSNNADFSNTQLCYQNSGAYKTEHIITCGTALVGQYIKIEIPTYDNNPKPLSLQELQIYNCQNGYYGRDCSSPCGNCLTTQICDKTFGACPSGCVSPFTGAQCKDCPDGYYGERCNIRCGHCIGDKCEKDTGNCRSGCNGNYDRPMCKECLASYYGMDCNSRCTYCQNYACGNSGECRDGCIGNYKPNQCTECLDGFYGPSCSQSCGSCLNSAACDKRDGNCLSGCALPFRGYYCKDCPDGYHGEQCDKECGHCVGNKCNKDTGDCPSGCIGNYNAPMCTFCKSGFHGSDCKLTCGHCNFGWCYMSTGFCNSGCLNGYFGDKCDGVCGNCRYPGSCDRDTGTCTNGCKPGYIGDKCIQECENGNYGQDCKEKCGNCLNDAVCTKTNGHCPSGCKPGFKENECKTECPDGSPCNTVGRTRSVAQERAVTIDNTTCEDGYYGEGCVSLCGNCLTNTVCDKENGRCPTGCKPGYIGDMCNECADGYSGINCELSSIECPNGSLCDTVGGTHPVARERAVTIDNTKPPTGYIIGLCIAIVFCVIATSLMAMFYFQKQKYLKLYIALDATRYVTFQKKPATDASEVVYEQPP